MDEEQNQPETQQPKNDGNPLVDKAMDNLGSELQKKAGKELGKKAAKGAAKKAAVNGSLTAALGPILFWVIVVIVAIIIVVGIIMFFMTMPGMVMEKLKNLSRAVGNYVGAFFGVDTSRQIDKEEIFDTLDYLEDMGYDIKNYGFLTDYFEEKDLSTVKNEVADSQRDDVKIDSNTGVARNSSGDIILAKSDFIFTYIASDNYIYTVKNGNLVTNPDSGNNTFWGFIDKIGRGIATLRMKINNYFFYQLNNRLGITKGIQDAWGRGLINIYYEGSDFGVEGDPYAGGFLNFDSVSVDTKSRELVLAKNGWFNKNSPMRYSLDGWTGRYGMPLEFLISVHLATLMPDLAYDMATSFDTNVNLYLRTVKGASKTYYKSEDGEYVPYDEVVSAGEDIMTGGSSGGAHERSKVYPSSHPLKCKCFVIDTDKYDKDFVKVLTALERGMELYVYPDGSGTAGYLVTNLQTEDDDVILTYKKDGIDRTVRYNRETRFARRLDDSNKYDVISGKEGNYIIDYDQDCIDYYNSVRSAMDGAQDSNYETYLPYIANVKNHWYRNVYYIIDTSNVEEDIVVNDYDYEVLTKSRWTLYETYSADDNDSEYKEYAKNNSGEFKNYVLNEKGEYATSSDIEKLENKTKIFKDAKYPEYYIYAGSQEDAKDEGIIIAKKAVVLGNNEDSNLEDELSDLRWNDIGGSRWSAYKPVEPTGDGSSGEMQRAYTDEQIAEHPEYADIYVQVSYSTGQIEQTGEGQRAETNPKIKKMFLENTYFRYDGTEKTAEVITAMRKKIKANKLGGKGDQYGALNNLLVSGTNTIDLTKENISYTSSELGLKSEDGEKTYNLKDYSGQVVLNQDSLNVFSMLENTHTLDADYIYKDFKELVVELQYFEKEELTEDTPKVLQWPVPDAPSLGYPERALDKREIRKETLIHSKGDVVAYRDLYLDQFGEQSPRRSSVKPSIDPYSIFEKSFNYRYGTFLTDNITPEQFVSKTQEMWNDMSSVGYNYCVRDLEKCKHIRGGACYLENTYEEAQAGRKIKNSNNTESYAVYNVSRPTYISWVMISFNTMFENFCGDLHDPHEVARTCVEDMCGRIITDFEELQAGDVIAFVEKGQTKVTGIDILGEKINEVFTRYTPEEGIKINAKPPVDLDKNEFYDTNKYEVCFGIRMFGHDKYIGYKGNEAVVSPVTGVLLEYGTYDGSQRDSLDNDTPYRVNYDLRYGPTIINNEDFEGQIVSENVGYAKILVLDTENYLRLEQSTTNKWKNNSLVDENGGFREALVDDDESTALNKVRFGYTVDDKYESSDKQWSKFDQTIYAYKEFAERYQKAGISGYIVYIDGFVCEEPDVSLEDVTTQIPYEGDASRKREARISIDDVSGSLVGKSFKQYTEDNFADRTKQMKSLYKDDEIIKMASKKATNKNEAEIRAKSGAAASLYTDGLIFIKEGTILGRTITDKELLESSEYRAKKFGSYEDNRKYSTWTDLSQNDNIIGNYLRVIMMDQSKKQVVENIEDYMKLGVEDDFDWFSLYFYSPFESGAINDRMGGPASISTCTPGEIAVGLIQETDLVYPYHNYKPGSAIAKLFRNCLKRDPVLCAPLRQYTGYDGIDTWGMIDFSYDPRGGEVYKGDVFHPEQNSPLYKPATGTTVAERVILPDGRVVPLGSPDAEGRTEPIAYVQNDGTLADEDGYKLWSEGIDQVYMFCGVPQRKVDKCRYIGGYGGADYLMMKKRIEECDMQKTLSDEVCSTQTNRDRFTRIQMEVGKEQYLDEILLSYPWLMDRHPAVQGAIMHILVFGSMSYTKWLDDYKDKSDEEILEQVKIDWGEHSSTASDASHDPTKGRAFTEPEIAERIVDGTISKFQVEDWCRTFKKDILVEAGLDWRGFDNGPSN